MKKNEDKKSLREVWEWKEKAYQEVKDLDLKNAIKKRLADAKQESRIYYPLNFF